MNLLNSGGLTYHSQLFTALGSDSAGQTLPSIVLTSAGGYTLSSADPDRVITLQNFGQTPGVNCTVRTTNSRLNISPSHFDYIINQSPVSVTVTGLNSTSTIYHDTLSVTCSNSTTIFSSGTFTIPFIH